MGELQTVFKSARLKDDHGVASAVPGDGLAPDARLAIYRCSSLEAGMFMWRVALAERQPLEEALEAARAATPDFNLTTVLQALFAESLVVDVIVSLTA